MLEGGFTVSLTVYDGANGIGGNKIYLEEGGWEYLSTLARTSANTELSTKRAEELGHSRHPRSHVPDLPPKLNIYRPDLIPSDLSIGPISSPRRRCHPPQPCPSRPLREYRNAQKGYSRSGLPGEHRHHEGNARCLALRLLNPIPPISHPSADR